MSIIKIIKENVAAIVFTVLSLILMIVSASGKWTSSNAADVSRGIEKGISRRIAMMDTYIDHALDVPSSEWLDLPEVPDDIVIYRYEDDTLQSWVHELPLANDGIHSGYSLQQLSHAGYGAVPPLSQLDSTVSLISLGPKWYLAKLKSGQSGTVVAAMELYTGSLNGMSHDMNPHLNIPDSYRIFPITGNIGETVSYNGTPLFMVAYNKGTGTFIFGDTIYRWLALILLAIAAMMLLKNHRRLRYLIPTIVFLGLLYAISRIWEAQMVTSSRFFSPSTYAGGRVWSSFGALLALDILVFTTINSIFLVRNQLLEIAGRNRRSRIIYAIVLAIAIAAVLLYTAASIYSLCVNSNLTLEPKWFRENTGYTILALICCSLLMGAVLLLAEMFCRAVGWTSSPLSLKGLCLWALLVSVFFFVFSVQMGFIKEQNRAKVWANRLAVDRDLELEIALRSREEQISADRFVTMLADVAGAESFIASRIEEQFLYQYLNDYDLSVYLCQQDDRDCLELFNSRIMGGTPIAEGSRFFCNYDINGHANYSGLFVYYTPQRNLVRMLLQIDYKYGHEHDGFESIFHKKSNPGNVTIPDRYSYAKFIDDKLVFFRGTYVFPTVLSESFKEASGMFHKFRYNGSTHFITQVYDNEYICIVRKNRSFLQSLASFLSILAVTLITMLTFARRHSWRETKRSKFRRKINSTLVLAIFSSLVVLAGISIKFVFDRNMQISQNTMISKLNTIQSLIESNINDLGEEGRMYTKEFRNQLTGLARSNEADISVFDVGGKLITSTEAEVYNKLLLCPRVDSKAYGDIVIKHQRVSIVKDEFEGKKYFSLYAPVFNKQEKMTAIVLTPYSASMDIMREALPHAVLMLLFLVTLLVIVSALATRMINKLFQPMDEVTRQMNSAGTRGLEYIIYRPEDEISSLVESYNRMVHDLSESSKILAQTERDKAWSEMARQVAHEIKNPLTPMKLSIQRLMHLKKNNPALLQERFDTTMPLIIEQIDRLTETANEFSTFAKLYTEEPVIMNLDEALQDQIAIFDNRDDLIYEYTGINGAAIKAPKPQLCRVFVNLIGNATQAVDNYNKDLVEKGEMPRKGHVLITLSNSDVDGYYEISIEDNGPGVNEENLSRLFTPNFTTKTAGTGLGLAISRNIIERCNGIIRYKKSFILGGACFIVRLPKNV